MTETAEFKQLLHAALDVVAPVDTYRYLRGYIEGYKAAMQEQEKQTAKERTANNDQ